MNSFQKFAISLGAATMLGACMHRGVDQVAAGDITIDSLSATRTAILRVDNASGEVARVYMKMPGMKEQYVAKALPGQARSWLLDPQLFPAGDVKFDVRRDNGTSMWTANYRVNKNEVVDITVPPAGGTVRASVHRSTR